MSFAEAAGDGRAPVALVDLGDTLCDCTPALRQGLARLRGPGENERDEALVPLPPYLEARRRQVMHAPGFWRGLAPRAPGFELLAMLWEAGFRVHILSKGPREAPHAWADKVAWCRAHLPGIPVTVTDDKALVHGHVLIDDWLPYVARWQLQWPAGLAIVPAHPWNAQAVAGPYCLRYDGRNGEAVMAALHACRRAAAGRQSKVCA